MPKVYHAVQQTATQLPLFNPSVKVCTKCNTEKPLEDFTFRKDTNKYRSHCKTCIRMISRRNSQERRARLIPSTPDSKQCLHCRQTLPASCFGRNKSVKDGLQDYCKECRKSLYRDNRETLRETSRQYRQENKEKINQRRRDSYQENRDKIRGRANQYRLNNPEKIKEKKRRDYQKNRDTVIKRSVLYQVEHKEAHNAQVRKYSKTPKGKLVGNESSRKRHALKRDTGNHTLKEKVDYAKILERDGYFCYICGGNIDPVVDGHDPAGLTFDHVKPLAGIGDSKGYYVPENIRPAHRCCNLRKGVKLLSEMTEWQRRGPNA